MEMKDIKKIGWLTLLSGALMSSNCNNTIGAEIDISSITSTDLTHLMTAGWNLGNTLDAHWNSRVWRAINTPSDQETLWGNPVTTQAMINKIKSAGFNTVRIPVTWYMFTGPGPEYKIADAWMDRVKEVVDYVIGSGMFCILNTHHEDYRSGEDGRGHWECGWLRLYDKAGSKPLSNEEKEELCNRLCRLWEQIAERFKDYNEYLLFEALNEPSTVGLEPASREMWIEQCTFLNDLMQAFVDTVRSGGGKNADRHLLITPYFASVGMDQNDGDGRIGLFTDKENKKLRVNDSRDRLIASLHYYEPWGFVMAPDDSPWFSAVFDLNKVNVSGNINNVLKIIEDNFISKGIPVIMGETGVMNRLMPNGRSNEDEMVKWADYYISKLKELGVPSIFWDGGGEMKMIDRNTLKWAYPDLTAAFVKAGNTAIKK
ncbi:MAG: glycoside hydrolase family 5 protein [Treponema sp.]|jgi:endoglucanase|nr:glycoside hydrolase family 5 protein [Treponema sp.]